MSRTVYSEDHLAFGELARAFVEREIVPHHPRWEEEGIVDREVWRAAGRAG